jgi:hypothetical protein
MKKFFKSSVSLMLSLVLLCLACVVPTGAAGGDVYELAFDNLFVFEQWANNENSSFVSPNATCGTISKDIAAGSFTLTNTSDSEIYTSYSMGSNVGFYSMPVKPNTTYIFEYNANGTVTSFETFVFYFASGHHKLSGAADTSESEISTRSYNEKFIFSAGMIFFHHQCISRLNIHIFLLFYSVRILYYKLFLRGTQ